MLPILILKFGTAAITRADGRPDEPIMVEVARQVARLHGTYRIAIVSSGAVGMGKRNMKSFSGNITDRKAAAAIGNPILISKYAQFFAPYGIAVAQSLCERSHFSNRPQFLQLKETFETLWAHDIIPIANENDVVSNLELRFSDNDELATLLAVGLGADRLLLGTSVPGLYDREGRVVRELTNIDESVLGLADKSKTTNGLGGMISKLTFARLATRMGIEVVIFGAKESNGILQALAGQTGTRCLAQASSLPARQKWLASSSLVAGRIVVDQGAKNALLKRKSLLVVGVTATKAPFEKGEVIELVCESNQPFALARAKLSATELRSRSKEKDLLLAHADDIVLL
jgi:glutamate 5-kinase